MLFSKAVYRVKPPLAVSSDGSKVIMMNRHHSFDRADAFVRWLRILPGRIAGRRGWAWAHFAVLPVLFFCQRPERQLTRFEVPKLCKPPTPLPDEIIA